MMNDKEFMKNNCNRCIKKSNENDLCNICLLYTSPSPRDTR